MGQTPRTALVGGNFFKRAYNQTMLSPENMVGFGCRTYGGDIAKQI